MLFCLYLFIYFFCVFLSSIIFIICDTNYQHLLLSYLHFAITSSHCNAPYITLSLSSIIFIISTLIIGIFYCINYTLLLLHLIITHLLNIFYNNYTINICPTLCHTFSFIYYFHYLYVNYGNFYCLNDTSLLLHLITTHLQNIFYNNYAINICPRQLLWFI